MIALLVAPFALTSCSGTPADQIGYAVDGPLVTYNPNTVVGAASAAPQAFARVLTGFAYHGPDGQMVADHDFGTVSVIGREPLVLDYTIADSAVYSDGKPITCDDMVLAWAAQSGRFSPASTPRATPATPTSPRSTATGAEEGAGDVRPGPSRSPTTPTVHAPRR